MSRPSTFGSDLTQIAADFAALPWPDHDARLLAEAYLRLVTVAEAARKFLELHDANALNLGPTSTVPALGIPQLREALSRVENGQASADK